MRIFIFILILLVQSCTYPKYMMSKKRPLSDQKNSVTILSASVQGEGLDKSDGRYFANKLSEYLLSDSLEVTERSLVRAYEIAMNLSDRDAYSPKELTRLSNNFTTNFYILSNCLRISDHELEVSVRLIDNAFKTKLIHSETLSSSNLESELFELLNDAALKVSHVL